MSASHFSLSRPALPVLLVVAVAGLCLFAMDDGGNQASAQPSPAVSQEVDVATVVEKNITDWHTYSGRLSAVEKVDVKALVSGTIMAVNIRDGALVKKGDVLFVIDPRPYQADVDGATGQLAAAQERANYTASDWERAQRLIGDNAIARRDFDEKRNAAREAAANVKTAQAGLDAANISLGFTKITAPVAGRVSRAEMTLGNVVSAGAATAPLTTIVSVSPIYAEFDADEQSYLQFIGRVKDDRRVPIELGLANEKSYSRRGVIHSVDNRIDTSSGTIRVRARLDNADGALVPGMYARIKMDSSTPYTALLIDDEAIGTDQDKRFVLVVDRDGTVSYREIQAGSLQGSLRVVLSGLQPGDRIVVKGTQRVRPGDKIRARMVKMHDGPQIEAPITEEPHARKLALMNRPSASRPHTKTLP